MPEQKKLENHIAKFFNDDHLSEVLNTIATCKITGWETWLQIEFAHFLQKQYLKEKKAEIPNEATLQWYREYRVVLDNEADEKKYIIPDFWYWSGINNGYYLVELKQARSFNDLKTEMKKDVDKITEHYKKHENRLTCENYDEIYINKGVYYVGVCVNEESSSHQEMELKGCKHVYTFVKGNSTVFVFKDRNAGNESSTTKANALETEPV